MTDKDLTYTFWIYGWNDTGRFLSTEDLMRCEVTTENVQIESQPVKDIPINSIQKCDAYIVGGRTFRRHMIRLKLVGEKSHDVFIFPANPLLPANEQSNGSEANSFCELVNGIISKRDVKINPNPYLRNKLPKQWAVEELDAYTSPWVYYHRYRTKPSLTRAVVQIIVTIVVLATLVILMGLFAEYLTR